MHTDTHHPLLQTQGLGTALKILFAAGESPTVTGHLVLRRNELVALFNGFARLSNSLHNLKLFTGQVQAEVNALNHNHHDAHIHCSS